MNPFKVVFSTVFLAIVGIETTLAIISGDIILFGLMLALTFFLMSSMRLKARLVEMHEILKEEKGRLTEHYERILREKSLQISRLIDENNMHRKTQAVLHDRAERLTQENRSLVESAKLKPSPFKSRKLKVKTATA